MINKPITVIKNGPPKWKPAPKNIEYEKGFNCALRFTKRLAEHIAQKDCLQCPARENCYGEGYADSQTCQEKILDWVYGEVK